jgi:hypothetical protein
MTITAIDNVSQNRQMWRLTATRPGQSISRSFDSWWECRDYVEDLIWSTSDIPLTSVLVTFEPGDSR